MGHKPLPKMNSNELIKYLAIQLELDHAKTEQCLADVIPKDDTFPKTEREEPYSNSTFAHYMVLFNKERIKRGLPKLSYNMLREEALHFYETGPNSEIIELFQDDNERTSARDLSHSGADPLIAMPVRDKKSDGTIDTSGYKKSKL